MLKAYKKERFFERPSSITFSERKSNRGAKETILIANLVLKVAAVREMDQFRVVDMEKEGGRVGPDLRDEENFQAFALTGWWGMRVESFLE